MREAGIMKGPFIDHVLIIKIQLQTDTLREVELGISPQMKLKDMPVRPGP
jgi:hypothetical protein